MSICTKPLFAGVTEDVDVKHVQTLLTELCYNLGPVDGIWWSKKTEIAAKSFFKKKIIEKKCESFSFIILFNHNYWGPQLVLKMHEIPLHLNKVQHVASKRQ